MKFWKVDDNGVSRSNDAWPVFGYYLIHLKALIGWAMALVVFILNLVIYKNPKVLGFPNFDQSEDFQGERTRLFGWIFWIAGISFIFHSFGLRKLGRRLVTIANNKDIRSDLPWYVDPSPAVVFGLKQYSKLVQLSAQYVTLEPCSI